MNLSVMRVYLYVPIMLSASNPVVNVKIYIIIYGVVIMDFFGNEFLREKV